MSTSTANRPTQTFRLNGQRYRLAGEEWTKRAGAGRAWRERRATAQEVNASPLVVPLTSFHNGAGFTFRQAEHVYDHADGWDAAAPGKIRTWARHALGNTVSSTGSKRGWVRFFNGQVWMMRGSKVTIYTISSTAGAAWSGSTTDLVSDWTSAANSIVGGQPDFFEGKMYIPVMISSTGAYDRFFEVTPGAPLVITKGPASPNTGFGLSHFKAWRKPDLGPVLAAADANGVRLCATTPTTTSNWGALTEAENSDFPVTALGVWLKYLVVMTKRGLWTFNENLVAINRLPDLQAEPDATNGQGMEYSNGWMVVPHKAGLVRWQPTAYQVIGPEQEGALDGALGRGWGRARGVVSHGGTAYVTHSDPTSGTCAIVAYRQPGPNTQRRPLVPFIIHEAEGTFEDICIANDSTDAHSYLCALHVAADGTTARLYVYELPRAGMVPANDPVVNHARDAATFYTSRIADPAMGVSKTYREVAFWLDASVTTGAGVKVYAALNGGSFVQLTNAAGATTACTTTGFYRLFFPKTSAAVGNYVQLKFEVPTKSGGETDASYTIREVVLRGSTRPLSTRLIDVVALLGNGGRDDPGGGMERRSAFQQAADLSELHGANSAPITFTSPTGRQGQAVEYCTVDELELIDSEYVPDSEQTIVARMVLRVESYA